MTQSKPNPVLGVIERLIAPDGCPWDREQTPQSLCDYLIEETFELVEAIRSNDMEEVEEELGDVFFLLFFVATLYARNGRTDIEQIWEKNAAKMIKRHPHVFDDLEVKNREQLLKNWERIKTAEKSQPHEDKAPGVFDSLPRSLPPLLKAYRINSKAARVGFTWESDEAQETALQSEWEEWLTAKATGTPEEMEMEFGDYIFTLAEYGRRKGIKANAALHHANSKFLRRFSGMERLARQNGKDVRELDLDAMNELWIAVKRDESSSG